MIYARKHPTLMSRSDTNKRRQLYIRKKRNGFFNKLIFLMAPKLTKRK